MWWEMSRGAYYASSKRIKVRIYWRKQHYINCFLCTAKRTPAGTDRYTLAAGTQTHVCFSRAGMKITLILLVRLSHRFFMELKKTRCRSPSPSGSFSSMYSDVQSLKCDSWFILIFLSIDRAFDATIDGVSWLNIYVLDAIRTCSSSRTVAWSGWILDSDWLLINVQSVVTICSMFWIVAL